MKAGGFIHRLFGRESRPVLELTDPVTGLRAVLLEGRGLRCGALYAEGEGAIVSLCRQLLAAGHGDVAVQIVYPNGDPAMFIGDIAATAKAGEAQP